VTIREVTADARVGDMDLDPMVAACGAPLLAADGVVLMTAVVHHLADGPDPWALARRA
jgi:hypothetical protein